MERSVYQRNVRFAAVASSQRLPHFGADALMNRLHARVTKNTVDVVLMETAGGKQGGSVTTASLGELIACV